MRALSSGLRLACIAVVIWGCGTSLCAPKNTDLLGNGATDGRIAPFAYGDAQTQANPSYDSANAWRVPVYWTMETGVGDLTSHCRQGDQLLSGGCVVADPNCYLSRSYPIIVAATERSGWHCRANHRASGAYCPGVTVLSLCAKSF